MTQPNEGQATKVRAPRKPKASSPENPAEDKAVSANTFTTKRGRPSASQVAAIDGAIIEVAKTMFLQNGYAITTMEAVASHLGVSKGTLYSRYPNKSDLFRAIVTERLAAWSPDVHEVNEEPSKDVSEFLFTTGLRFLSAFRDPEVAAFDHMIVSEASRFPELFREFNDQGYAPFIDRTILEIERLSAQSGWPISDARGVAVGFISSLLGWYRMVSLIDEATPEETARYVARQVAIIVGGRASW